LFASGGDPFAVALRVALSLQLVTAETGSVNLTHHWFLTGIALDFLHPLFYFHMRTFMSENSSSLQTTAEMFYQKGSNIMFLPNSLRFQVRKRHQKTNAGKKRIEECMPVKAYILFVLLLFTISLPLPVRAEGGDHFSPSPRDQSCSNTEEKKSANIGVWLVSFYQEHLSKVDGDRCPSFPSCSSYSIQAFQKHGFFMGWMMTVDRLFHEGSEEEKVSPLVFDHGKMKIFDPVENNDFWWHFSPAGGGHD